MQPASELFLGWGTSEATNKQFYVRQLRDAKIKPAVETFNTEMLLGYATDGWSHGLTPRPETRRGSVVISDQATSSIEPSAISGGLRRPG